MAKNSPSTTCVSPASSTENLIRQHLVRYGEFYRQPITPALINLWLEHFGNEEPGRLEKALRRAEAESEFFPTPATIRRMMREPEAAEDKVEANRAFDALVTYVRRWGPERMPDYTGSAERDGKPVYAPELLTATQHVLRQMGGYERVAQMLEEGDQEQVHWLRKGFMDLYEYSRQTENFLAPSREEARRLLAQVSEERPKTSLG